MAIKGSDYLVWYNNEINRYRDHEWQLASFSFALSSAVVIFLKNPDHENIISQYASAVLIAIFISLMSFAECHTHMKLNQYRERRELLLQGKEHKGKERSDKFEIKVHFFESRIDAFYFMCFLILPILFGIVAICIVLANNQIF